MQIEIIPLMKIKSYWRNARINSLAVEAVKESIKKYGFNSPIIVDKNLVIIAGHSRWKAASQLGLGEIPVIVANHLNESQAKQYRIIDNKTSELAKWDMNLLLPELREFEGLEDFTDFFPELSLEEVDAGSIGAGHTPIKQNEIDSVADKLDNKFSGNNSTQSDIRHLTCPNCGEEFDARIPN